MGPTRTTRHSSIPASCSQCMSALGPACVKTQTMLTAANYLYKFRPLYQRSPVNQGLRDIKFLQGATRQRSHTSSVTSRISVHKTGGPTYLGKLTNPLGGMPGLGFVGRTAKIHCGGFISGALQCKT